MQGSGLCRGKVLLFLLVFGCIVFGLSPWGKVSVEASENGVPEEGKEEKIAISENTVVSGNSEEKGYEPEKTTSSSNEI